MTVLTTDFFVESLIYFVYAFLRTIPIYPAIAVKIVLRIVVPYEDKNSLKNSII